MPLYPSRVSNCRPAITVKEFYVLVTLKRLDNFKHNGILGFPIGYQAWMRVL
jgi:hypothetical protein